jgi:phosphatidylethanolamine/phosphatidyl-N-methylethanolamine N-methyltransferase
MAGWTLLLSMAPESGADFADTHRVNVAQIIYGPLSPLYDLVCGSMLQPGRRRALALLDPRPGEKILEVGAGSGYNINGYPPGCNVLAVDLSAAMLARAKDRVDDAHRATVRFAQMDAQRLAVPTAAFDAVFVPYTINVLPDPLAACREIVRACHPNGRIVFVNHFGDVEETRNTINRIAGKFAEAADVDWDLRLDTLVSALPLRVKRVEPVNVPKLSTVVLCERTAGLAA